MPDRTGASVRRRRIAGERARKADDPTRSPRPSAPSRPKPRREPADRPAEPRGSSWTPGRRTYAWFVPLCVVALAAAVIAGWSAYRDYRDGRIADARTDAVAPAGQAVEALLSYRHDTLDSELESERDLMTDAYADKFLKIFPDQAKTLTENAQATVESTVLAAAALECDDCSADSAQVLVYVDTESTVQGAAPEVKANRAVVTMEREDGTWRVDEIELF